MKDGLADSACQTLGTKLSDGKESLRKKVLRFTAYVVLALAALCLTGCNLGQEQLSYLEGRAIEQMDFNRRMGNHEFYGTFDMGLFSYTNLER